MDWKARVESRRGVVLEIQAGFSPIAFGNQTVSRGCAETHGFVSLPHDRFTFIGAIAALKEHALQMRNRSINDVGHRLSTVALLEKPSNSIPTHGIPRPSLSSKTTARGTTRRFGQFRRFCDTRIC